MTILITGSSGKTSSRLAPLLPSSHSPLIASRSGTFPNASIPAAKFDWLDESTWNGPFEHEQAKKSPITGIYLVMPPTLDGPAVTKKFVDFAKAKGVKRFVYLGASSFDADGPAHGEVHAHLKANAEEWAVLRPTWFMENFSQQATFHTIKNEGKIYSCTKSGKMPFISAEDIAAVACRTLIDEKPHNTDYLVLGPELFSYDDAAVLFTDILGKKVEHVNLEPKEREAQFQGMGIIPGLAEMLMKLEIGIANGEEEISDDAVKRVTGKEPKKLIDFIKENREIWL